MVNLFPVSHHYFLLGLFHWGFSTVRNCRHLAIEVWMERYHHSGLLPPSVGSEFLYLI